MWASQDNEQLLLLNQNAYSSFIDDDTYKDVNYDYNDGKDYDENLDASFNFAFESKKVTHQENSNKNGERYGSYSYIDPTGKKVLVKYRAGVNGFEILNPEDVLPKAPKV